MLHFHLSTTNISTARANFIPQGFCVRVEKNPSSRLPRICKNLSTNFFIYFHMNDDHNTVFKRI